VRTSDGVLTQSLPFADASWRTSESTTVRYRFATMMPSEGIAEGAMPRVAGRKGKIAPEHGVHHEIGWERQSGKSDVAVRVYSDKIYDPVLEARTQWSADSGPTETGALYDPLSGLTRVSGQGFSSAGVEAEVARQLPGDMLVRASYANGNAVVMPALPQAVFEDMVASSHPRRVQTYAISLSGTLEGSGTRWRASYRWQPEDTVTEVAPFALAAIAPYLNLRICQKMHESGSTRLEALLQVQNLLAQGYRPYLLADGSTLIFAQNQRALRAGLVFTF
jgi:hypothetical protein